MQFSVLISVYKNENANFFDQALESILIKQTRIPNEVVIVEDGPLTTELEEVITKYSKLFSRIIKVIKLKENKGLGQALKIGLEECSYEIVARMDSDDISVENRFQKQLEFLEQNQNISVVGAYISEFYDNPKEVKFTRVVPKVQNEISKMLKRRNPMNHVTVMFKKGDLKKAGGYEHLPYLEDYYIWARMIGNKLELANIEESLVLVRTGEDMYKRRSNPEYIKSWAILQKEMSKMKLINSIDYMINMINIIVFIYLPSGVKENTYKFLLRRKAC